MKNVWIVYKDYNNTSNDGIRIFSTKQKAQKYCNELNEDADYNQHEIYSYKLDSKECAN